MAEPNALETYINQQLQINLGAWQQQADNAITDAQPPAKEDSRFYFYVALAGNLVWASTCFLDPLVAGEAVLIKLMSFSGATYGSGALQQVDVGDGSPDDAKVLIRQMLAKKRGELEEYFKGFRQKWATDLGQLAAKAAPGSQSTQVLDTRDKYLWQAMFPTVPYDTNRFDTVRSTFLTVINGALADFNQQWQKFLQQASWFGGAERKKHNIYFRPVLKIYWGGKVISGAPDPAPPYGPGQKPYFY